MRADRLLAILLILQRGERTTAGELARRLEVSERTIYRDVEALGASGVPIYSEQGRKGGIRLLGTYRTDLTGLSLGEAELVPLLGLSDVFGDVGVGSSLRRTEAKLLMSMPEDQRKRAEQSRRRVYVDLSRWWEHAEAVPHLATVVEAVFAGRRLRMRYRRGEDGAVVRRTVDPFGLVVQGGTWYLVARARGRVSEPRTYRVSRILSAEPLDEHHVVPEEFDLPSFWAGRKDEFHMTRRGYTVTAHVSPNALRALRRDPPHGGNLDVAEERPDGWMTVTMSFEYRGRAFERLMALGAGVVVVEPADLRDGIARSIRDLAAAYGVSAPSADAP